MSYFRFTRKPDECANRQLDSRFKKKKSTIWQAYVHNNNNSTIIGYEKKTKAYNYILIRNVLQSNRMWK